ncbi:hypothetical protein C8J56DRAFT_754251, partial [Mycena floridula]
FTSENFTLRFYEEATKGLHDPGFHLSANEMPDLVIELEKLINQSVFEHDYTSLLSPDRAFGLVGHPTVPLIPGQGIEEETVSTLFNLKKCEPHRSRLFRFLYNDWASIAFSLPMRAAGDISDERLDEMELFGALVALMLICGKYPEPFSPLFLQFMLHNMNIHALTESFVKEWCPELARDIRSLIDAGPSGDISHLNPLFESYCDASVHVYHSRTERSHSLLASEVLYRCVVGREPPLHPELQAFYKGFKLASRNGFEFPKTLVNCYPGGSDGFLSLCSLSKVTSFATISQHVFFKSPSVAFDTQLGATIDLQDQPFHFQQFMIEFLQGQGAPIPDLWSQCVNMFASDLLPLSSVGEPWFRSRMFVWAVTGAPELRADIINSNQSITVILCQPDHPQYGDSTISSALRANFASRGQLCMHTCPNTVLIPAPYFGVLAAQVRRGFQGTQDEVREVIKRGLHHWLLAELVNAIGKHNIL